MESDDLCAQEADQGTQVTVRQLDDDTVLIEADDDGLRFLARLLISMCDEDEDSRQLGPNGPGGALFSPDSTLGLYVHRLPCERA